jgi:hypothetical protein
MVCDTHVSSPATIWSKKEYRHLGDGRPDRSSWTFVLSSLNIRHHFLKFDSFITPSPQSISIGQTFCAFKNRITARTSHSAGFSIFLLNFIYYKKSLNDRISASFIWLVTKRLLRHVNLEMVQFVDLRKCYVQTVFTFWTTLVCVQISVYASNE